MSNDSTLPFTAHSSSTTPNRALRTPGSPALLLPRPTHFAQPLQPLDPQVAIDAAERVKKAFAQWDRNSDGYIDASDIEAVLNEAQIRHDSESVKATLAINDLNHDGKVSYEEFSKCFLHKLQHISSERSQPPNDLQIEMEQSFSKQRHKTTL